MSIRTPQQITSVAWEGKLIANTGYLTPSSSVPPIVTLATMDIWPITDVFNISAKEAQALHPNTKNVWVLRQGIAIQQKSPISNITEAQLTIYLRPHSAYNFTATYARDLFPKQSRQNSNAYPIHLNSNLTFSDTLNQPPSQAHTAIAFRQTYPVIQGHGAGECAPHWVFKPQDATALEGTQFVYATVVTQNTALDITVELVVTVNTLRGEIRFGLPSKARTRARFHISQQEVYNAEKVRS